MQSEFEKQLGENFPYLLQNKFLIAISGGVDSVVLAYLCKNTNLDFALAHCNFQLRGKESDLDEEFVEKLAKELNIDFFVKRFNTRKEAGAQTSIQLLAREQRYTWFSELLRKGEYQYVLTAHHLDDDIETFFINLLRGTGLEGLLGIPVENNKIIRPLLKFSRNQIEEFAKNNKIPWREDLTNQSDDYQRNRLRHHLIPLLEKENPDFRKAFILTQNHLQQAQNLNQDYKNHLEKELMSKKEGLLYYDIEKISALSNLESVLYVLFNSYGFTAWKDIEALLTAESGKIILSKTHRLIKDRKHLILGNRQNLIKTEFFIEKEQKSLNFTAGKLICENVIKVTSFDKRMAYLAADKLVFPLKLRIWKPGDRFRPLGMKGQKKVSDFLKDEKLNLFEKENTWVLLSENSIVWVVGLQISEDFKIDEDTHKIFKIEWIK